MTTQTIICILGYLFFNPLSLAAYFFVINPALEKSNFKTMTNMSYNSFSIHLVPFFISVFLMSGLFLVSSFLFISSLKNMSFIEFIQPKSFYLQIGCYFLTFIVISNFSASKGVEGNIAGFFYFPIIVATSATLAVIHFKWIWQFVIKG